MNSSRESNAGFEDDRLEKYAFINATQLAKLLGISKRSLYRLKSSGKLPRHLEFGGSVRWRLDDIREWIEAQNPQSNGG